MCTGDPQDRPRPPPCRATVIRDQFRVHMQGTPRWPGRASRIFIGFSFFYAQKRRTDGRRAKGQIGMQNSVRKRSNRPCCVPTKFRFSEFRMNLIVKSTNRDRRVIRKLIKIFDMPTQSFCTPMPALIDAPNGLERFMQVVRSMQVPPPMLP